MKKEIKRMAMEVLEHGTVKFEKHHSWMNEFTGKRCTEHLRHIEYNGDLWDISFVNNKLYSAFIIK